MNKVVSLLILSSLLAQCVVYAEMGSSTKEQVAPSFSGVDSSSKQSERAPADGAVIPDKCKSGKKGYIYWAAHDQVFAFRFDPSKPLYPRQGYKGHVVGDWIPWAPDPSEPEGCYGNPLRGDEVPYLKQYDEALYQNIFGRKLNGYIHNGWSHGFYAIPSERHLRDDQNETNKSRFLSGRSCTNRASGIVECQFKSQIPKGFDFKGRTREDYNTLALKIGSRLIYEDPKSGGDLFVQISNDWYGEILKEGRAGSAVMTVYQAVRLDASCRILPNEIDLLVPYYRALTKYMTSAHVDGYSWTQKD